MNDLKAFEAALQTYIRPGSFPVAIRMVEAGESLPDRVRRPLKDLGLRLAICQGVAMARRYGWVVALSREDVSCPPARAIFGLEPRLEYFEQGMACYGMYTATPEAGAVTEAQVARFEPGRYEAILAAPLFRTTFEPHLVLIYGNPAQVMRLVAAALWREGGRLTSSFSGRADCSDSTIVTMQTGQCQVILPCYGDRIFAMTQDHEMAFTVPAARLGEIIEGLEGTHRGGIRYPMPHFVRAEVEYPPSYQKMEELWREARGG